MTSLRIDQFSGMAPRLSVRALPHTGAVDARNCRLLSGELRGFRQPTLEYEPTLGVGEVLKSVYRTEKDDGTTVWMTFLNPDVDVVKGPLVNDAYDRYYWTGEEDFVAYLPIDDIAAAVTPNRLGVPSPVTAPGLSVAGGASPVETRAYCYTFVNTYGEESAPSPAVEVSGNTNGSWNLTGLETAGTDMTNRTALVTKNIYRTISGENSVEFFFVASVALATTTYNDTSSNATVAQNPILQSYNWRVPPDALVGLIAHPAGFLAGFVGRDLYFSEPYRPHAWPTQYILALDFMIVGLAIYNNMLCVLTTSQPYFVAGSHPSSMSPIKSPSIETCLSKGSIAATIAGVLYASPNGIVLFNENGPQVITQNIMTNEEWVDYRPAAIRAAQYGQTYVAFYETTQGFKFSPNEPMSLFTKIDHFTDVQNIVTDVLTGRLWLVMDNKVWEWEPPDGGHLYYTWLSKQFDFTRPVNFGACMLKYSDFVPTPTEEILAAALEFNTARIVYPLHTFNQVTYNGTREYTLAGSPIDPTTGNEFVQNKYPFGGSPLLSLASIEAAVGYVQLTIWADGNMVFSQNVASTRMRRLPAHFKAHVWQFQLVGNVDIYSFAIAETAKELEAV